MVGFQDGSAWLQDCFPESQNKTSAVSQLSLLLFQCMQSSLVLNRLTQDRRVFHCMYSGLFYTLWSTLGCLCMKCGNLFIKELQAEDRVTVL